MGFCATSPAPEKSDPTAENRVWGFFGEAQETHRENRPQSPQPRQGNRLAPTTIASGRTYWPSRDPLEENWETFEYNVYGFVNNSSIEYIDILGLKRTRSGAGRGSGRGNHRMDQLAQRAKRSRSRSRKNRSESPSNKTEKARLGGLRDLVANAIPKSFGSVYYDVRLAVIPFAPPVGSLELVGYLDGRVTCCRNKDGSKGILFIGELGLEVSAGIGTSIGGTSGVRANRQKNPYDGHRGYNTRDSQGRPRGAPRPTIFDSGNTEQTTTRSKGSTGVNGSDIPPCEDTVAFALKVGVSGFVSAGAGRFSVGAEFDKPLGGCNFPGECDFSFSKPSSGGLIYGMGSGARVQAYGRGAGTGNLVLSR